MKILFALTILSFVTACSHPIEIVGEGDIVSSTGTNDCSLEEQPCDNYVTGDYKVTYTAVPRPGWFFTGWQGCGKQFPDCSFNVPGSEVDQYWGETMPSLTANFEQSPGKYPIQQGYLKASGVVSGVAYETLTIKGVTGTDGSFEYREGEPVRFMIGNILLGEVTGQSQVTPFDLAGSEVLTGIKINWALADEKDPFQAVVNITVLLESLDDDANPENGIVINPEVVALFQGLSPYLSTSVARESYYNLPTELSLDVSQPWQVLQNEQRLRHVFGKANAQKLFSVAHKLVKPEAALQHLYVALNIDPKTVGISLRQADIVVYSGAHDLQEERFQYDANGRITRVDYNRNDYLNGAFETWQYDASGNVTNQDVYVEEKLSFARTNQYDENGNLLRQLHYRGPDRVLKFSISYLHDADGNPIRSVYLENGDRYVPRINSWQYAYAANANLSRVTHDGGYIAGTESWQYDIDGNITRQETYINRDAEVEHQIVTSQYDDKGNVTREQLDDDGDGNIDNTAVWRYEYGAEGFLTQKTRTDNGQLREVETWLYDVNGNLIQHEIDSYSDALTKTIAHWEYDPAENITQHDCTGLCEGAIYVGFIPNQVLETWKYHENGNISLITGFQSGEVESFSGEIYTTETNWQYSYDASGNLLYKVGTGASETWQYDEDGNTVHYASDDGYTLETGTYEYVNTGWGHLFCDIYPYCEDVLSWTDLPTQPPKPNPWH